MLTQDKINELREQWLNFFIEKSTHCEQKYLTPDTNGIILEFIETLLKEQRDEVLKVVVETTSKEIQKELDAGGFYKICSNETTFKNYIIGLLSEHLSPNKENENNG